MMRVLFRDQEDSCLFAAEIAVVTFDPESQQLSFFSADDDTITIPDITQNLADSIITNLYEEGKANLSSYQAYLNIEPPEKPDTSPLQDPDENKPSHKMLGFFHRKDPQDKEPWEQ